MKENHNIGITLFDGGYGYNGIYVRDSTTLRELYDLVKDFKKTLDDGHEFVPWGIEINLREFMEDDTEW